MPGLVGGFGKLTKYSFSYYIFSKKFYFLINKNFNYFFKLKLNKLNLITKNYNTITKLNENNTIYNSTINNYNINYSNLGPYLAGLIEGDGTIAIHDPNNQNNKYNPKIIIIFKKSDLKLATFLQIITKSGIILNKPERGYIL
ncbi:LAGLIDADG family homing endonuclease [Klebsiella pneumoniae]|uniref:LAGLIDADG family homing endonuclease n=1 Tax=Klebsiella pneumoniae TaxID=573 RepID=UPI00223FFDE4|nr:LAGLIDADG family homing endonuclease [Klebsiella pneumoniae]